MTPSTLTSDLLAGSEAPSTGQPALFEVLHCDDLSRPSHCYPLGGMLRVALGRGTRPARSAELALVIEVDDQHASTTHAELRKRGGRWVARDCDSKNGTYVGGVKIAEASLADGDVVEIGHTFFVYRERALVRAEGLSIPAAGIVPDLVSLEPELVRAFEQVGQVAITEAPVLLLGETGTGKEVMSRAIHQLSARSGKFIAVNCAAIPEPLAEAELFGVRKGAFSDATRDRTGLFAAAAGGTILLDEIGDLPVTIQAKLLRVLEDQVIRPVGDVESEASDFRLIAATNRDVEGENSGLRADLYHRVAGATVQLPPLRERLVDLGIILSAIGSRLWPEGAASYRLHPRAARAFFAHPWPGSIRELVRCLESAAAVATDGVIQLPHLPASMQAAPSNLPAPERVGETDRTQLDEFVARLREHKGNLAAVARDLGTSRAQVHRLLARYDLDVARFRADS